MKEFIGKFACRLPDVDGHAQFLFVHSSGTLLKVTLKPGVPLPSVHRRVVVLGNFFAGKIDAQAIILAGDFQTPARQNRIDLR